MPDQPEKSASPAHQDPIEVNAKQLVEDIKSGLTFQEIANRHNVSDARLQNFFNQLVAKEAVSKGEIPPAPTPYDSTELIEWLKTQTAQSQGDDERNGDATFGQTHLEPAVSFLRRSQISIIAGGLAVAALLVVAGTYWVKDKRVTEAKSDQEQAAGIERETWLREEFEAEERRLEPEKTELPREPEAQKVDTGITEEIERFLQESEAVGKQQAKAVQEENRRRNQAEIERQRQAEVESQRQAEIERQRQAEVESQRQAEIEGQRQAEVESQHQAEEEKTEATAHFETYADIMGFIRVFEYGYQTGALSRFALRKKTTEFLDKLAELKAHPTANPEVIQRLDRAGSHLIQAVQSLDNREAVRLLTLFSDGATPALRLMAEEMEAK